VLRRIFGPDREGMAGDWRRLHNVGVHNLCAAPNIIRVIRSRGMNLTRHVARVGEIRNAYKIFVRKRRDHSEHLGVVGKIILEGTLG
jgi:hypothetical protein